eukprot:TRINITY_DN11941_c0_g1_i1.p1 TRINITY_DN11941_c0_g1~~TRINITY_DN11941_c0_g1_i1.p1  ORF type:complete len:155 (-),score=10.03 TRINITY_DN11941_c0_g1_i1:241-669(-)
MGPMLVMKHMCPLLVAGGMERVQCQSKQPFAVVANLSSRTGSIGENRIGRGFSYRASEAALNQFSKTASIEMASRELPVVTVLLQPEAVEATMDVSSHTAQTPAIEISISERAADRVLDVIDGVAMEDNGRFIAHDGTSVAW